MGNNRREEDRSWDFFIDGVPQIGLVVAVVVVFAAICRFFF